MYYNMYRNMVPRVNNKKEIKVVGVGRKVVKSDMAVLVFDIIVEDVDPFQAITKNEKQVEDTNALLNEYGIKEENIFYTSNELIPVYDENNVVKSYIASTNYRILIYDILMLGEILYNLEGADVFVEEVHFTLSDPVTHYNQALEEAISDVYMKSSQVAKQMGVTIESTPQELIETTELHDLIEGISTRRIEAVVELMEGFVVLFATVEAKFSIVTE